MTKLTIIYNGSYVFQHTISCYSAHRAKTENNIFTLHAKLSSTVYCNRSCLWVCVCLWVCYHDNSKLRASIFTKLGL